jgi:hypothetical protein
VILRSTVPCTFLLQLVALRLRAGVITHLSTCSVWLSGNEENFSVQDRYSRLSKCRVQTKNRHRRELIASDKSPQYLLGLVIQQRRGLFAPEAAPQEAGWENGTLPATCVCLTLYHQTLHTYTHHLHLDYASTRLVDTRTKHAARMGVRRPRESRDMEEGD